MDTPSPALAAVCVYCGSSPGRSPRFESAARALGAAIGQARLRLIYGGGGTGLMGSIARATRAAGGTVTGIIPDFLVQREGQNIELDEYLVVPDMHTRKRMMFERADGFVALPGGIGTLEELIEMLTWSQLGRHGKPIVIANIDGFWEPLAALLAHMRTQGFLRHDPDFSPRYQVVERIDDVLPALRAAMEQGPAAAPIIKF